LFLRIHGTAEDLLALFIPFSLEVFVGDEAQGGRVDAIAQPSLFARPIIEDMAEVALPMLRSDFDAGHAEALVHPLHHVGRLQEHGETRPTATAVELLGGGKERLPETIST
jgi:hypothetical protein